jgi:uncharacterized RDD family membrane protein YckC
MTQFSENHPDPIRAPQFYSSVPSKRLIAWIIDIAVTILMTLLFIPFTAFIGLFFFPVLAMLIGFAYRTLTIASSSATWGMRMMSIELRDARGERFDFGQALVHTLGYSFSFAFVLIQFVSVILMLGSARGQSLIDLALGSVMINRH